MSRAVTDDQRKQLLSLARELRKQAEPVGPLHGLWDLIADMEELAAGRETLLDEPVDWYISYAQGCVGDDAR